MRTNIAPPHAEVTSLLPLSCVNVDFAIFSLHAFLPPRVIFSELGRLALNSIHEKFAQISLHKRRSYHAWESHSILDYLIGFYDRLCWIADFSYVHSLLAIVFSVDSDWSLLLSIFYTCESVKSSWSRRRRRTSSHDFLCATHDYSRKMPEIVTAINAINKSVNFDLNLIL